MSLTAREKELLYELTAMVDIDTLNDNLAKAEKGLASEGELLHLLAKLLKEDVPLPPPNASEALSFDEVEDAGLDGTLRDM